MAFEPADLWSAWTACRSAWERQLFSDPLLHAEFEIADVPPGLDFTLERVEVDVRTRPKQSGGVRIEMFPDAHTATLLQAVAHRLQRRTATTTMSVSEDPHSGPLAVANPYEAWCSAIRTWTRKELASGRVVICADVQNFFPSIAAPAIARVLGRGGLDPDIEELTINLLNRLRTFGRRSPSHGAGLPVCPGEFFWLVADRVLLNIDAALERAPDILGHTRWTDDFLLSARPSTERAALHQLDMCARHNGFQLNGRKTRMFSSWQDYQARNLVSEHQSVNDLIAVHRNGNSRSQIDVLLPALNSLESVDRREGARLLGRVYELAALARIPTLVGRVEADIEHYPVVERSLFRYLATLGWPDPSRALLLRAIGEPAHDTLALSALSALLNDSASTQSAPEVKRALLDASFGSSPCHPLARVAAQACLTRMSPAGERARLADDFLDRVPALDSASARRAALALAWLIPTLRGRIAKLVRDDDSIVVRDLWTCLAQSPRRVVRPGLERIAFGGGRTRWGGLEKRLARTLGDWQSAANASKVRPGPEAEQGR